jgi:hypothetical protein
VQEEYIQTDSDEIGNEIFGWGETYFRALVDEFGEDSLLMNEDGTYRAAMEEVYAFHPFNGCTKTCNSEVSLNDPIVVKYNNYSNGYLDGSQMEFYSNGLLKSKMTYRMGKPIGEHVFYNYKGEKAGIINYDLEGKKHGQCIRIDEGSYENFVHGKKQGKCFYVSSDTVRMEVYDNGQLVSSKPNVKLKELIEIYGTFR